MSKKILIVFIFLNLITPSILATQIFENDSFQNNTNSMDSENQKIVNLINMINKSMVSNYLKELLKFGPRLSGTENCSKAADYLFSEFEKMGYEVEFQNWKFPLRKDKNVVATLEGSDSNSNAVFIVCSHYDSWKNSPGANDDGSGVAAMLAIAKVMSGNSFNHTVRFLAVSGHEIGPSYVYGSFAYAKEAYYRNENIVGVLVLDMIGNTTKAGNVLQMHISYRTEWMWYFTQKIQEKYSEYLDTVVESIHNLAADEQSFIEYGFDAVFFIQPNFWEPPNHCPEDNINTINFDFLTNATKLLAAITCELADNPINVQVRIVSPKEGYLYLFNKGILCLPGFNLRPLKIRGMTYLLGSTTFKIDITTDEEINAVYYTIDGDLEVLDDIRTEPPYDIKIKKHHSKNIWLRGKHTIGVTVTTYNGNIAYDEMDVFFL